MMINEKHAVQLVIHEIEKDPVPENYTEMNIKLVWYSKTLQNWKALVADLNHEGGFYEVTYNGVKKETYIDKYVKLWNRVVSD